VATVAEDVAAARVEPPTEATPSARVRARLARFGGRSSVAFPALEPVMLAARTHHPKADLSVLEQAYLVAERAHRGQLRKSGDPYITPRCCTTRSRTPTTRSTNCARTSAPRSPCSSTG
jgi:GTP pyrophosphokinase